MLLEKDMANIGYALDESGVNPANKVTERRILTSKVVDGRCFMIPKVTPFFADGLVITYGNTQLIEDVDYQLILQSPELSERLPKSVFGGILFHKLELNQIVDLEYQTPGGDFNLPLGHTTENLIRLIRNPYFTTFSQILGTPLGLPTYEHIHDWHSTQDYASMDNRLNQLYMVLASRGGSGSGDSGSWATALLQHLNASVAHTKAQVGLGNLQNYPLAQFADFAGPTYPNDKYVTPRTVMYGINIYIGDKLAGFEEELAGFKETIADTNSNWNQLQVSWNDLKATLDTINRNYTTMVTSVQGYNQSLIALNQSYQTVIENQNQWQLTVSDFNTKLLQYGQSYDAFVLTRDTLLDEFATVKSNFTTLSQAVTNYVSTLTAIGERVTRIETHALYPATKTITSGSYHFRIKPGEKYNITLIGGGGGVGEYITDPPSLSSIMNGEHGQPTSFWCIQAHNNTGAWSPASKPIVVAGGGFGGCSSYGDVGGVVASYGIGGRGGNFEIQDNTVTILEASAGEGGLKGYGVYQATDLSTQEMGYDLFGSMWGRGATTAKAVGQGGEGAKVQFVYENKTTKELEYMITVGNRGRSYNPAKNNAVGGLAIITKV